MRDTVETDPVTGAFAKFRNDMRPEILPPGPAAARTTVRARRNARFVVGALLAIALVGGVGALTNVYRGGSPGDRAGASGTPADLAVQARNALSYTPGATPPANPPLITPVLPPGIVFRGIPDSADPLSIDIDNDGVPLQVGDYALRAACVGRGNVKADWSAPGGRTGTFYVACGVAPGMSAVILTTLPEPGALHVTLTPDEAAAGHAGVAVAVSDPNVVAAKNRLGDTPPGATLSGADSLLISMSSIQSAGTAPGTYDLVIACAGSGALKLTFLAGGDPGVSLMSCTEFGQLLTLTASVAAPGSEITLAVMPDGNALGHAGIAYYLVKT